MYKDIERFVKNNTENKLFIISILIYIIWSIFVISSRIPFFDETNAWNIAANCNFFELFEVAKHEGHLILWYLIIKPFASMDIGFPYSMFVINWIISFASVIVLWLFAPFDKWLKMFVTFSMPIQMYTAYARCYSIGVFFLFIICAIYSKRFKHPFVNCTLKSGQLTNE